MAVWFDEAQGLGAGADAGAGVLVDQLKLVVDAWGLVIEGAFCAMPPPILGCSGFENCVAEGVRASNRFRSGVTVRNGAAALGAGLGATEGLGVDQENCGDWVAVLDTDAPAVAAAGASQPESMGLLSVAWRVVFPLTSLSKSSSVAPLVASNVVPDTPPKAIKSSFGVATRPSVTAESSCSFLVCSSSTRLERDLINSIKDWNCLRLRSGPRLIFHKIGRISIATKSASATSPTTRRTLKAAVMTAGSFVLITLISGTIFSCMVYLSRALDEEVFFFSIPKPSKPSSPAPSREPPHRTTNACSPRTLIARLFVLLKTVATTGNSSFLIVLKSKTGRIIGSPRIATSTSDGVGDSTAVKNIGKISKKRV